MKKYKYSYGSPEEKQAIQNRLNRVAGQARGISQMIEDSRDFDDVLIQLTALDKSIKSIANLILESHMKHYLSPETNKENKQIIEDVIHVFKRLQ